MKNCEDCKYRKYSGTESYCIIFNDDIFREDCNEWEALNKEE